MAACALLAGCGDEPATISVPEGCQAIAFEHDCLLPWPSDAFRTGEGVAVPVAAQPRDERDEPLDFLALHPADGFSPGTQILALFPQAIDPAPLTGAADDLLESLGEASPTVLLDADSGARILHLAELDPRTADDTRRALVLRPLERLAGGRRYLVALRGLTDLSGQPIPAPAGFEAIRDGHGADHPALAAVAERYEREVFPPLGAAGIARAELQLAWDFTVRSEGDAIADMVAVREAVLARATPVPLVVTVEDDPSEHIARRIELSVEVPMFVEEDAPLAPLRRGADGRPVAAGTLAVPFTVWIPKSVAAGTSPARLLQYGHGFFGGRTEVDGFPSELADELGFVIVAADWQGMSEPDAGAVVGLLASDPEKVALFTDRVHQAMANFLTVAAVAQGPLLELPELAIGPEPLYDASALYYYGISQGGILGGSYLALSPRIERAVLSVGGADFSLMMFRARPFLPFLLFIETSVPDRLEQQKLAAMVQSSFDRIDPLSFTPLYWQAPLAGAPNRRLLMQIGIGDAQVPNLASHLQARALGLSHLGPAPRALALLEERQGPLDGAAAGDSALCEHDFGIDPLPGLEAEPPGADNEAHEGVRRLAAAKEQLDRFLRAGGVIEHTCEGPCDPE